MKNYRITVEYDGTRYRGWQVLKNSDATIQGKLQNVLATLAGCEIDVIGSGRTDAGVHAIGQVANFHIPEVKKEDGTSCTREDIREYLNRYLPEDIAVTAIDEVDERFHSRYHAEAKTYRYRIHTSTTPNVFERKYVYTYLDAPLDVERMKKAAAYLVGTYDFASFCGNRKMKKSTVRTIFAIDIRSDEREIVIDYTGDGFLQNMIRIITGTLIEIGSGRLAPEDMERIRDARDRASAGYTAPPQGLMLMEVTYGKVGSCK